MLCRAAIFGAGCANTRPHYFRRCCRKSIAVNSACQNRRSLLGRFTADNLRLTLSGVTTPLDGVVPMNELRPLPTVVKLALMKASRVVKMTPTAKAVLHFFIDEASSRAWSLLRLAHAVGRSPRAVDAAIAQLKELGFIATVHRRRATALRVVNVDAILAAVKGGVERAKQASAAAISMIRRGVQASRISASNIHSHLEKVLENTPWRSQGAPTPSLLRALGMPGGTNRG